MIISSATARMRLLQGVLQGKPRTAERMAPGGCHACLSSLGSPWVRTGREYVLGLADVLKTDCVHKGLDWRMCSSLTAFRVVEGTLIALSSSLEAQYI